MPGDSTTIRYRPDIDGLRAVAVLAVIGFHASPRFVPGGFVGVDIFFVISGFLISAILFTANQQGRFSFIDFYSRRIRRIFPALAVVLVSVWACGWFVLVGDEYRLLEKHLAGGSGFLSNVLLWQEAGYFDAPSEFKPLLHLWSLGIEEQFYLLWPPIVYFCWQRGLNVASITVALIAVSFAMNVAVIKASPLAAFYLLHTRLWELLIGGLLAYAVSFRGEEVEAWLQRVVFASADNQSNPRNAQFVANLKAWSGLALIAVAIFGLGKNTSFPGWWFGIPGIRELAIAVGVDRAVYPGWWGVLPTLGTVLMIWAGQRAWINRAVLARRPLVYLGLMSYPLYLWHWPLLSLLQITESGHPSRALRTSAVALSFFLAWLTYRAIEQPIRRTVKVGTPLRVVAVAMSLLMIGSLSAYSYSTNRWTSRTPSFATAADPGEPSPRNDEQCRERFHTPGECQQYSAAGTVTTVILGDSHAQHFLYGVGRRLAGKGVNVAHLGASRCPPLLDVQSFVVGDQDGCEVVNNAVLRSVGEDSTITRVLLSFRGTVYVTGRGFGKIESNLNVVFRTAANNSSAQEGMQHALEETVNYLLRNKKEVWVLLQVPELDFVVAECAGRPFSFETKVRTPCAVAKAAVLERQAPYRQVVQDVKRRIPALNVFDPLQYLCDERWCFAIVDNQLLYYDGNHLSRTGSLFFADKFPF
jgi:peptidoglycan/LPS O-acetylase OafA/YrhL